MVLTSVFKPKKLLKSVQFLLKTYNKLKAKLPKKGSIIFIFEGERHDCSLSNCNLCFGYSQLNFHF